MGRGRPKKTLDNQTKHLTKEEIQKRDYEENLIKIDDKNIKAPNWLKDRVAKNEFKRLVGLLEKIDIICELDRNYHRVILRHSSICISDGAKSICHG